MSMKFSAFIMLKIAWLTQNDTGTRTNARVPDNCYQRPTSVLAFNLSKLTQAVQA